MKHLRESQIAQINRKLMLRERELRERIHEEIARAEGERHISVLGRVREEPAAGVAADLDTAMVDRHMRELAQIEAAWTRLRGGIYGICIDCGEEIPWQRLLAYPVSERCIQCMERQDHIRAHEGTPSL